MCNKNLIEVDDDDVAKAVHVAVHAMVDGRSAVK